MSHPNGFFGMSHCSHREIEAGEGASEPLDPPIRSNPPCLRVVIAYHNGSNPWTASIPGASLTIAKSKIDFERYYVTRLAEAHGHDFSGVFV